MGEGAVDPKHRRGASRRWLPLLLVVALIAALGAAACGDDDDEGGTPATTTEETAPPEEEAQEEVPEGGEEEAGEGGAPGGIDVAQGDPEQGRQIFAANCAVCHGAQGEGVSAPALQNPRLAQEEEAVVEQIVEGGGGMPAFGEQLSDEEIADVAAFVTQDLAQR